MAYISQQTWSASVQSQSGYKAITTFWLDFSIADRFGAKAVKDTFNHAFKEWREDYKYLTELVLVLNHKIWQHYQAGDQQLAKVYDEIWRKADNWAYKRLKGEAAQYYFQTLD